MLFIRIKAIWKILRSEIIREWDVFSAIILEPLLLAFFIFLIFAHIQTDIDYSSATGISFTDAWNMDITQSWGLYIGFFIVFLLWVISKAQQARRSLDNSRALNNRLMGIENSINNLANEIRKDRNERNKPEGKI
jgi:hypothetical protein